MIQLIRFLLFALVGCISIVTSLPISGAKTGTKNFDFEIQRSQKIIPHSALSDVSLLDKRLASHQQSKLGGHGSKYHHDYSTSDDITLADIEKALYHLEITIGSDLQLLKVLLDIGFPYLWIIGSENPFCIPHDHHHDDPNPQNMPHYFNVSGPFPPSPPPPGSVNCSLFGTFNTSLSTSFVSNDGNFSFSFDDDTFASGFWGHDTVNISGSINVDLPFGVADHSNSSTPVLGVGLKSDNVASNYENLPAKLVSEGIISKPAYSLYVGGNNTGSIVFGGTDPSKYTGQLYTLPLVNPFSVNGVESPVEFDVTLSGVSVNGKSITGNDKYYALLDSSTSLTYAPYPLVVELSQALGAAYSDDLGYFITTCATDGAVTFNFQGAVISVPVSDFLIQLTDDSENLLKDTTGAEICGVAIFDSGVDSGFILGDTFLKNAYVVFDLEDLEVSIAQAAQADSVSSSASATPIVTSVPGAKKAPNYSKTWGPTNTPTKTSYSLKTATHKLTGVTSKADNQFINFASQNQKQGSH